MVTRRARNQLDLSRRDRFPAVFTDHPARPFVVPAPIRGVHMSDVVQERCRLQAEALALAKLVKRGKRRKQRERHLADLQNVFRLPFMPEHQGFDFLELFDRGRHDSNVERAIPEAANADLHHLRAEDIHRRGKDRGSCGNNVGP